MRVRSLIKTSGVTLLCTTDDPVDDLRWHKMIKDDPEFDVQVLPAWRPDKVMNIEKPEFTEYIKTLPKLFPDSDLRYIQKIAAVLNGSNDTMGFQLHVLMFLPIFQIFPNPKHRL